MEEFDSDDHERPIETYPGFIGMTIDYDFFPESKYRGPVLIHASLNVNRKACLKLGLDPAILPTGGVVGIADIVDCVTRHRSRWFEGPYGFVLKNRRALPFVKWRGGLGLRTPPKRLLNRIGLSLSNEYPKVLGSREFSTMVSTWTEFLRLSKADADTALLEACQYEALGVLDEPKGDGEEPIVPEEIGGKKVIGVDDGYIIVGG
jgi:hypothetical protein